MTVSPEQMREALASAEAWVADDDGACCPNPEGACITCESIYLARALLAEHRAHGQTAAALEHVVKYGVPSGPFRVIPDTPKIRWQEQTKRLLASPLVALALDTHRKETNG